MIKAKEVFIPLLIVTCLFAGLHTFNKNIIKPKLTVTREQEAINFSPVFIKLFSMGNERFYSSILWVHTLLSSDQEHYAHNDLSSWMYLRFNTISLLDPKFYKNYLYGGQFLSIVKDDLFGAEDIYLKGLSIFPKDFDLKLLLGFNYYFEMRDFKKGVEVYKEILNHPDAKKIQGLPTLVATLVAKEGDLELGLQIALNQYKLAKAPHIKKALEDKIYSLRTEIDLRCLNAGKTGCNTIDSRGDAYIIKDGRYVAQSDWQDFRTKRKKRERKKTNKR